MKQIDTIISTGRLTGEQVGRLLLRDYARTIKAVQGGRVPPPDMFTEAEKQKMVNSLKEPHEIRQYNTYIGILQFLQKTSLLYLEQHEQLRYLLTATMNELTVVKNIPIVKLLLADAPLILTEPQYKRLKAKDLEEKTNRQASVWSIILTATKYYVKNYTLEPQGLVKGKTDKEQEETVSNEAYAIVTGLLDKVPAEEKTGDKTIKDIIGDRVSEIQNSKPYAHLFKAYKNQPLTNPEFKKTYWQEGANGHYETPDGKSSNTLEAEEWLQEVDYWHKKERETGEDLIKWVNDGREAPADATKYNILEYVDGFFTQHASDLDIFKNDYPELYEAILTELKGIKGLGINEIPPEKYGEPLISYKTLHDLDLPYYREYFRYNPKDGEAFIASFISVIPEEELAHWSEWKKNNYLDKEGNYLYRLDDYGKTQITQHLPSMLYKVKQHLKRLLAIQELYRILGEQINEKDIIELATDNYKVVDDDEPNGEQDTETDKLKKQARKLGLEHQPLIDALIAVINSDIEESIKEMLRKSSPVISEQTIQEVHEAFKEVQPVKWNELKPAKEAIEKVKELTKDLTYYGTKGLNLHDILTEAV